MLDAWLTRRQLGRRADRAAATARSARASARAHWRDARDGVRDWCASWQGLMTLFGAGLAGGVASERLDARPDRDAACTGEAGEAQVEVKRSFLRDLAVLTLARASTALLIGGIAGGDRTSPPTDTAG